jgi:hypothetical protein
MMRFLTGCVCLIIGHTAWGAQKPYFQQETNYKIHVRLDDFRNELFADEEIEYVNNSPEALPFIYFHLWPNAYKNNQTELAKQLLENGSTNFNFSPEADKGYIDQLDFKAGSGLNNLCSMENGLQSALLFMSKFHLANSQGSVTWGNSTRSLNGIPNLLYTTAMVGTRCLF